jgi:hypothetical protein
MTGLFAARNDDSPLVIVGGPPRHCERSEAIHARFARIDNGKWRMKNDRKGTRRFQNTTFSIFNFPLSIRAPRAPFSIRPKGAPRWIASPWRVRNDGFFRLQLFFLVKPKLSEGAVPALRNKLVKENLPGFSGNILIHNNIAQKIQPVF